MRVGVCVLEQSKAHRINRLQWRIKSAGKERPTFSAQLQFLSLFAKPVLFRTQLDQSVIFGVPIYGQADEGSEDF